MTVAPRRTEDTLPLARTIALPDSRLLCYDDVGSLGGLPVIFFHGMPGSRRYWQITGPGDPASEKNVRLISPDRPGIGRSSPAPHRSVRSTAADVLALADQLGLERFSLVGFSGGCTYALAVAAAQPERVMGAALVSPVADLAVPGHLSGLDPLTRKGLSFIAGLRPNRIRLPDGLDKGRALAAAVGRVWSLLPSADRRALSRPHVKLAAARMLEEAARRGLEGVRLDAEVLMRPWEFSLDEVRVPVQVHAGTADPWSTPEMVHWLRLGLADCRVRWYPGGGHFTALITHADEILESLVGPVVAAERCAGA